MRINRLAALAAVTVFALAATACGGDDKNSGSGSGGEHPNGCRCWTGTHGGRRRTRRAPTIR